MTETQQPYERPAGEIRKELRGQGLTSREQAVALKSPDVFKTYQGGAITLYDAELALGLRYQKVQLRDDIESTAGIIARRYKERTRELIGALTRYIEA